MSGSAVKRLGGLMVAVAIVIPTAQPPNRPTASLTMGRLHYDGGGDWDANPSSLPNLLQAIATRTRLPVTAREKTVSLSDADLWQIPYLYMTGHGNVHWSDAELATLRRYLQQGGFL